MLDSSLYRRYIFLITDWQPKIISEKKKKIMLQHIACYFYTQQKARISKIYSGFILFFAFALFVGTVLSDNTVAKVGKKMFIAPVY